jgi:6,7-dimethyl-8-ribityllumazine synthase
MPTNLEGHLDAKGMRFAILVSRTNDMVCHRLQAGAEDYLERHGVGQDGRTIVKVPGSWELPLAAKKVAATGKFDPIVALGALVRGETPHFDVLVAQVAKGLSQVSLESGIPVSFGVLTVDSLDQGIERAGGKAGNKGRDAAEAAIEMVSLLRRLG